MKSDETHSTSLCERVELHEWHRPPPPGTHTPGSRWGGAHQILLQPLNPLNPQASHLGEGPRGGRSATWRWPERDGDGGGTGPLRLGGTGGCWGGVAPPCPRPRSPSSSSLRRGQRDAHGTVRALLFLGGQRSPAALPRALRGGAWDRPPPRRPRPSKRLCLLLLKPPRSTHFCSWHLSNAAPLIKN